MKQPKQKPVYVWVARDLKGAYIDETVITLDRLKRNRITGVWMMQRGSISDLLWIKGNPFNLKKGQTKLMKLVEVKE